MITIRNIQRKILIDKVALQHDIRRILKKLDYEDYDISITLVNDDRIRMLNRTYREKDQPTDILSFPFHTDLKPGERIQAQSADEKDLGDLIINAPYVVRAAADLGVTFDERLRTLLVHGVYHLLGYDHVTDEDYEIMHRLEQAMLKHLEMASEQEQH